MCLDFYLIYSAYNLAKPKMTARFKANTIIHSPECQITGIWMCLCYEIQCFELENTHRNLEKEPSLIRFICFSKFSCHIFNSDGFRWFSYFLYFFRIFFEFFHFSSSKQPECSQILASPRLCFTKKLQIGFSAMNVSYPKSQFITLPAMFAW
jgi:hypothetical protein